MDNSGLIVQILAVVLILFLCFVTYMNTKTWRATHVTFLFLVFGASLAFAVYASLILKTRKAWLQKVETLTADLETKSKEADVKLNGQPVVPKAKLDEFGLRDYKSALHREIIDRGRVWRGLIFQGAELAEEDALTKDAIVNVKLTNIPPGNQGERVPSHNLPQDAVVYAFKDKNPNVPHTHYVYVGEFKASAVAENTITLTSTTPVSELDQGLARGNEPWILYERMPPDSQHVFTNVEPLLGTNEQPFKVTPADVLKPVDFVNEAARMAALREYLRDGMTLEQVIEDRKKNNEPELTPEQLQARMFANVKFLKPYSLKVDAGGPMDGRSPASGNVEAFDASGQALEPRLRRGEPGTVDFKEGDTAQMILYGFTDANGMVIERGAEDLQKEGIVEIESTVYRRPLHDYAYEFAHMRARMNQIRDSLRLVNYEIGVVAEEERLANANAKQRSEEKTRLLADQTKVQEEKDKLAKYAGELEAAYRATRAELSRLYRENASLHERIVAANDELTREIESRETTPTAAVR